MNEVLVSVIIPAYNAKKYILPCINSILSQQYGNLEILVMDDCSSDGTYEILKGIRDRRIVLHQNSENKGVVYSRNYLLNKANGAFIALQDADDWSHPERISEQVEFLRKNPSFAACGTQYIKVINAKNSYTSNLPTDPEVIREKIPQAYNFLPATLLFRKEVIDTFGVYSDFFGNDGNEDIYWISKIILKGGFANLNHHLYYYRLNLNSLTKFQNIKPRRLYISKVTEVLLNDFRATGSNVLERENKIELQKIEDIAKESITRANDFELFKNVVGQLLHFNVYGLSISKTIEFMFAKGYYKECIKLIAFILKKAIWK